MNLLNLSYFNVLKSEVMSYFYNTPYIPAILKVPYFKGWDIHHFLEYKAGLKLSLYGEVYTTHIQHLNRPH